MPNIYGRYLSQSNDADVANAKIDSFESSGPMLDIDLQEEQAVEFQQELSAAQDQEQQLASGSSREPRGDLYDRSRFISQISFCNRVRRNYFGAQDFNWDLIENPEQLWCQWLGIVSDRGVSRIKFLTTRAISQLIKHKQQFQNGIDIDIDGHLPLGFIVEKDCLDYSPNLARIARVSPLAVRCYDPATKIPDPSAIERSEKLIAGFKAAGDGRDKWWEILYARHFAAFPDDHLPNLTAAFAEFCRELTKYTPEYDLQFYPLPEAAFADVRSLPTALSRILVILKNCSPENRKLQWEAIHQISLHSDAAIKVASRSSSPQARFVIPEMQIIPARYRPLEGYYGFREVKDIVAESNDEEELKINFYRYLAYQPHCLPLEFYLSAISSIEHHKFNPIQKKQLYSCLASSTTGAKIIGMAGDIAAWQRQWQNICDAISKIPTTANIQNDFIENIFNLEVVPSLPFLEKLIFLMSRSISFKGFVDGRLRQLAHMRDTLNAILDLYGNAVYEGMRFYDVMNKDESTDINNSILVTHLATALKISENFKKGMQFIIKENFACLIKLISTFNLHIATDQEISKIVEIVIRLSEKGRGSDLHNLLILLGEIKQNKGLNAEKLIAFLNQIGEKIIYDIEMVNAERIELIRNCFKENFEENFFQKLEEDSKRISYELQEKIREYWGDKEQSKLVEKFFKKFKNNEQICNGVLAATYLGEICKNLKEYEQDLFLSSLIEESILHQPQTPSLEKFKNLFLKINDSGPGSQNYFLFFLSCLKALPTNQTDSSEILDKVLIFYGEVMDWMRVQKTPNMSTLDRAPFLIRALLKSPGDQFELPVIVDRTDQEVFSELVKNIAAENIDLKLLEPIKNIQDQYGKIPPNPDLSKLWELSPHLFGIVQSLDEMEKICKSNLILLDKFLEQKNKSDLNCRELFELRDDLKNIMLPKLQDAQRYLIQFNLAEIKNLTAPESMKKMHAITNKYKSARDALAREHKRRESFVGVLVDSAACVDKLLGICPQAKDILLILMDNYLKIIDPQKMNVSGSLWNFVSLMFKIAGEINNPGLIYALIYQFKSKPENLFEILRIVDTHGAANKNIALNIVVALASKNIEVDSAKLEELLINKGSILNQIFEICFKNPPYPDLAEILEWGLDIIEKYAEFDLSPATRAANNGFNAREGLRKYRAEHPDELLIDSKYIAKISRLETSCREMSKKTTEQILQEAKNPSNRENLPMLLALVAELLYRSQSKQGQAFEMNTTQYLAVLEALETGQHVTSEIATGEGKSRIMMMLAACEYLRGQTVDFVTSDMQLARRDFFTYGAFFESLGAKPILIYGTSPATAYNIEHGIHFTSASSLALFRNKANVANLGDLVINPDQQKRSLLLDECDKTYFDSASTRFNYSTAADDNIRGMEWVYSLLVEFISRKTNLEKFEENKTTCGADFINYARTCVSQKQMEQLEQLALVNLDKIISWLAAAIEASKLLEGVNYNVQPDEFRLKGGRLQYLSHTESLQANRASAGTYSYGVEQCLRARLNLERKKPSSKLHKQCKTPFEIKAETQIIYSSNSADLCKDYAKGRIKAVTGTMGTLAEQLEVQALYGMKFIQVARHRGLHRDDLAPEYATNPEDYMKILLNNICQALSRKQPILILCANDPKSSELYQQIKTRLPAAIQEWNLHHQANQHIADFSDDHLQQIHSAMSADEEKQKVERAGAAGMITVSTDMIGRGTDIELNDAAKNFGLSVMVTYIPRPRDLAQMFGRSGRYGAKGDARLILNLTGLRIRNLRELNAYIKKRQNALDKIAQKDRLIKFVVQGCYAKLRDDFFQLYHRPEFKNEQRTILGLWIKFSQGFDEQANKIYASALKDPPVGTDLATHIQTILQSSRETLNQSWENFSNELNKLSASFGSGLTSSSTTQIHPRSNLNLALIDEHLKLDPKITALLNGEQPKFEVAASGLESEAESEDLKILRQSLIRLAQIQLRYQGKNIERLQAIERIKQIINSTWEYSHSQNLEVEQRKEIKIFMLDRVKEVRDDVQKDHKKRGALRLLGRFQPKSRLVKELEHAINEIEPHSDASSARTNGSNLHN